MSYILCIPISINPCHCLSSGTWHCGLCTKVEDMSYILCSSYIHKPLSLSLQWHMALWTVYKSRRRHISYVVPTTINPCHCLFSGTWHCGLCTKGEDVSYILCSSYIHKPLSLSLQWHMALWTVYKSGRRHISYVVPTTINPCHYLSSGTWHCGLCTKVEDMSYILCSSHNHKPLSLSLQWHMALWTVYKSGRHVIYLM